MFGITIYWEFSYYFSYSFWSDGTKLVLENKNLITKLVKVFNIVIEAFSFHSEFLPNKLHYPIINFDHTYFDVLI